MPIEGDQLLQDPVGVLGREIAAQQASAAAARLGVRETVPKNATDGWMGEAEHVDLGDTFARGALVKTGVICRGQAHGCSPNLNLNRDARSREFVQAEAKTAERHRFGHVGAADARVGRRRQLGGYDAVEYLVEPRAIAVALRFGVPSQLRHDAAELKRMAFLLDGDWDAGAGTAQGVPDLNGGVTLADFDDVSLRSSQPSTLGAADPDPAFLLLDRTQGQRG